MDNLLFANIPHNTNDDELRSWIEDHGFKVDGLTLVRDAVTGSSPAFARVKLDGPAPDAAIVLDQQQFGGRRLHVRRGRSPLDD